MLILILQAVLGQQNSKPSKRQVVPALCSWMHDNPEGRAVMMMWASNSAEQVCVLCYQERLWFENLQLGLLSKPKFARVLAMVR